MSSPPGAGAAGGCRGFGPFTTNLLRDREFVFFWCARTISVTGGSMSALALPVIVFQRTGSATLTGLLSALEFLPYMMVGLVAGALADRSDPRRLMVAAELANVLLMGSIPVAHLLGVLGVGQVLLVATLSSTALVWFDAAQFAGIPALVSRDRIVPAMSALGAGTSAGEVGGPALAGLLIAGVGTSAAVSVDAMSYLVSALLILTVRRQLSGSRAVSDVTVGSRTVLRRLKADVVEGLQFIWRSAPMRSTTLITASVSVTGEAVSALIVVYAVRVLGLKPVSGLIGVLLTAGAFGGILSALALPRLVQHQPRHRITAVSLGINLAALGGLAMTVRGGKAGAGRDPPPPGASSASAARGVPYSCDQPRVSCSTVTPSQPLAAAVSREHHPSCPCTPPSSPSRLGVGGPGPAAGTTRSARLLRRTRRRHRPGGGSPSPVLLCCSLDGPSPTAAPIVGVTWRGTGPAADLTTGPVPARLRPAPAPPPRSRSAGGRAPSRSGAGSPRCR